MEKAYLAGGCFWCIEEAFQGIDGITSTSCGYMGGSSPNPTYEEVCHGLNGHREVVKIQFDPDRITYLQILELFFRNIDPFDETGQFADRGKQYETAIFYHTEYQKQKALYIKEAIETLFKKKVATQILPSASFYKAEEEHQIYCKKNPLHFFAYQKNHANHLKQIWGRKKIPLDLKELLTPLQYKVTQKEGTEPPFQNAYWDHHEDGIYVDRISGDPLFSSKDKFDSKTGWPSFTRVIDQTKVIQREDQHLLYSRIEVLGAQSHSHLGHVFPDGPPPTGQRFCMNSAALRFIPRNKMVQEGYEDYFS